MARPKSQPPEEEFLPGRALRRLRNERGISQTELAAEMRAAGFSWMPNTVSKIELDPTNEQWRRLSWGEGVRLCKILGIPASAFGAPIDEGDLDTARIVGQGEVVADGIRSLVQHIEVVRSQASTFREGLETLPAEVRGEGRLGKLSVLGSNETLTALSRARAEVGPLTIEGRANPDRIGVVVESDGRSIQFTSQAALDHFNATGELVDGATPLD
ncbi:MAG TPA: helix-turn-helix transcriptional regulator [Pseudolysinimonas sp.]|nr:helix-turn-helix transcriptional regulator [Pseudolysinimonas sp.]